MADIVERLRSSEPLPACPYDRLSPHYWTAPDDQPCAVCGGLNDPDAPDLCRGADTRIMGEAADLIEQLREMAALSFQWMAAHDRLLGFIQSDPQRLKDFIAWPDKPELPNPESTRRLALAFGQSTKSSEDGK